MTFNLNDLLFNWPELHYLELENELGINALKMLNSNIEGSLVQIKKDFSDIIKSDISYNSLSPEEQGSYYSHFYLEEDSTIKVLQRQQRYAIVLAIFSYFEGRLKSICKTIDDRFNFKIKLNDLNGNEDLMRYWNYLEKVFEIDTKKILPFFTPIKQQKIIRNIIAHQEGNITPEQKTKITFTSGLHVKIIMNSNVIDIEKDNYVNFLLNKVEIFLTELLKAIDNKYGERIN